MSPPVWRLIRANRPPAPPAFADDSLPRESDYLSGLDLRSSRPAMFGIPTDSHDKELHDNADKASAKLTRANRDVLWWVLGAFFAGAGIMWAIHLLMR